MIEQLVHGGVYDSSFFMKQLVTNENDECLFRGEIKNKSELKIFDLIKLVKVTV